MAAKQTLRQTVFSLYRQFLRSARAKDADGALGLVDMVKTEFPRSCHSVGRREFQRIEYMLRDGHKQLKLLQMPGVTSFSVKR